MQEIDKVKRLIILAQRGTDRTDPVPGMISDEIQVLFSFSDKLDACRQMQGR